MNGDWESRPKSTTSRHALRAPCSTSPTARESSSWTRARSAPSSLHNAGAALDLGLGPDAADSEWTAEQLGAALASRRGPIKPALLDQKLIAGLGNIYAAESLWHARIGPRVPCASRSRRRV